MSFLHVSFATVIYRYVNGDVVIVGTLQKEISLRENCEKEYNWAAWIHKQP